MKKRWIDVMLAVAVCLGLSGCSSGETSSMPDLAQGPYTNGSYEVKMPQYEGGWQEYGKITVSDGYITAVEYDARNEAGEKKSQDTAYRDSMAAGNAANGLPAVYPEKVYNDLVTAFHAVEYDLQKVDAVAGATTSSENFKKVMAALMERVENGQTGEITLPLYEDGVYEVEMPEYDNGWKDFVRVTIADGTVDSIVFDAKNEQGDLKSADEEYRQSMIAGNVANGLPETYPADADIVIGVPDSGLDAALGFAKKSGIPYGIGLIKNKYIGRTFISPGQSERLDQVRIKLSPVKSVINGKRVVLIDDSIVRGTTSKRIVKLLREAGAKEIHMRISAPPFLHPCYYGTDIDSEENLIACRHSTEEIAELIGADSLGYLEAEKLHELIGSGDYCAACFHGNYPTKIPMDLRKDRFERKLSERDQEKRI